MSTETTTVAGYRRFHRRRAAGVATALVAALLLTGTAFAHGPGGPGQGPGFGMGPGMMMGPQGGPGMMGPGMMMGPWGGQGMMGPGMMMGPWAGQGTPPAWCGQGFANCPGMMMGPQGGPGMMGPWGGQGMMGPGMMMGPRGGQGFGGGPGMMGPQQGGPGMMGPQRGQGAAPGPKTALPGRDLTADDVRARLENWLRHMGNPRLEVGDVKEVDEDTIVADIVTKEGKTLVDRFRIDRHTGAMQREG
ncbi:MAG TPA: hypothetical protein ENJ83_05090 [Rhodospirillales bacterium]|nr:hypothetical protein [Rhodospirillales bacterium]